MAADVRGGAPGTIGADYGWVAAICLAGGSLYGLEAASGVAAELFARSGYSTAWSDIALVAGAIIYDFGPRANGIYPDKTLGRAALKAARGGSFPLGPRGAGRSATVGKSPTPLQSEPSGQGGAFRMVGGVRLAVFTIVNAVGTVVDRQGRVVRGNLDPATGDRFGHLTSLESRLAGRSDPLPSPTNTTLTVVVTDRRLDGRSLQQVGRQVHSSMARAIQPFHGPFDGDVLFTVSTNAVRESRLDPIDIAAVASELAWDAVLCSFDPVL
jgi:L-aminopeptidase/D-esterase-like protein